MRTAGPVLQIESEILSRCMGDRQFFGQKTPPESRQLRGRSEGEREAKADEARRYLSTRRLAEFWQRGPAMAEYRTNHSSHSNQGISQHCPYYQVISVRFMLRDPRDGVGGVVLEIHQIHHHQVRYQPHPEQKRSQTPAMSEGECSI